MTVILDRNMRLLPDNDAVTHRSWASFRPSSPWPRRHRRDTLAPNRVTMPLSVSALRDHRRTAGRQPVVRVRECPNACRKYSATWSSYRIKHERHHDRARAQSRRSNMVAGVRSRPRPPPRRSIACRLMLSRHTRLLHHRCPFEGCFRLRIGCGSCLKTRHILSARERVDDIARQACEQGVVDAPSRRSGTRSQFGCLSRIAVQIQVRRNSTLVVGNPKRRGTMPKSGTLEQRAAIRDGRPATCAFADLVTLPS